MPRKPDPTRKPELLGQILDHLTQRTLATVSFRTLAEALGVSTYVFVYHFGNRAQLVDEIVRAIVARHASLLSVDPTGFNEAEWADFWRAAWAEVSSDRGLQLQRLEFEAAMLEMVDGAPQGVARGAVARWHGFTTSWVVSRGVAPEVADAEARLFVDAFFGLQYDALATGEIDRVGRAFARQIESFGPRIAALASGASV